MVTRTFLMAAAPAVLGVALFGCGGDSGGGATPAGGGGTTATEQGASAPKAAPIDPAETGDVVIKVKLEGQPPENEAIDMSGDPKCHEQHAAAPAKTETVIVKDGNLVNCFVFVKDGLGDRKFDVPKESVVLDQKGCTYSPHVFGVMVDQTIEIKNSDPTLHNVHAVPKKNPQFNQGQPAGTEPIKKKFKTAEIMVPIKCDVHSWMKTYAGVLPHPFHGVTKDDGTVTLKGLPAGEYTIGIWHEKFATTPREEKVTVKPKETATVEVTLKAS